MMKKYSKQVGLSKNRKRFYEKKCVRRAEKIIHNKKKVGRVIRKARGIFERLHNIPRCDALSKNICSFCDLLSDYFDGIYQKLPLSTIVAILGGLIYLVMPIDVLSDFIPVLGWLDDAAVLAFVVAAEQNDVKEYLTWKDEQPTPNAIPLTRCK